MSEGREALRAGLCPLSQNYVEAVLSGNKWKSGIDYVYGVYLHRVGLTFSNKRFDVHDADNIIIDDVRYAGISGLYELIFKRIQDDLLYTEDDMKKYKSILLATNEHKHKHQAQGRLLSNRGYKYKHIIAPLMSITPKKQSKKSGKGLPHAMTLNDNAIDYVHLDDSNELVNLGAERRRLVEELHAPARRNFPRRRVIVQGYDGLWQVGIVEMRPYSSFNRDHHYILTVIDEQVRVGRSRERV
ncbi:hypothetical protein ALC57_05213 [Trachymyrmex cornetzi]|uniref:DUF8207 domain-containing protein n=1 Tax=Trachymyrmex cornetzi TaxID=471704 RepID=A0A151JB71_9HYME|nr:hypothetical protein ALC57_05213 [Trachymyrmex cornetzi]